MEPRDWTDEVHGMTITSVRGLSLRDVGEVLAFRWDTERETTFREAEEQQDPGMMAYAVQVGDLNGWTVLVEPNGYAAGLPATVARLSRGGAAVSVFWTVNAAMGFVLARGGDVVRRFDPLLYDLDPQGQALPEEEGLPFGIPGEGLQRAALTLAERITGFRLDREWVLETARPTWTTASPLLPPGGRGAVVPGTLLPELPENTGRPADPGAS